MNTTHKEFIRKYLDAISGNLKPDNLYDFIAFMQQTDMMNQEEESDTDKIYEMFTNYYHTN